MRPKIVPGTPLEYKNLMKQCWDAGPSKRPDIVTLDEKINEINLFYQNKSNELLTQPEENNNFEIENCTSRSKLFTSKLHQFDNLPEPRNATEEEQEAFHSNKSYDFYIPNNVDDFNKSSSKKNITSKIGTIFEAAKIYPIYLKEAQKMDYKVESMRKRIKKLHINDNDEYEAHNNPNLHSEEQDELELPENEKDEETPEVLRGKPYTATSDVYSFSMIMWEFTSGVPGVPQFNNRAHDIQLSLSICKGERPKIIENTPQCYVDLMEKCWDENPLKRPSSKKF
ncbi:hypothetical protein RhiirA1_473380 [Rhizophagus irregularis]|uniref:Serine-threonine/tyrosine-protein kinase catalytic domain-containing protein n=1 Tax=Rhizophagus irregularis TaxID=588596 RepID=A0A2N0R0N6_9GLOM|nr:hypothetical protein RhiirA1_473380 [Rhizophagus irregularis]